MMASSIVCFFLFALRACQICYRRSRGRNCHIHIGLGRSTGYVLCTWFIHLALLYRILVLVVWVGFVLVVFLVSDHPDFC